MEKIVLPENHKRAVASSMCLIEKLVDELENELLHSKEKVMTKIMDENKTIDLQHYTLVIQEIKSHVRFMADKYNLSPSYFNLSQVINSRKSKMWEVLCDTKSAKMKGRGKFPKEYVQEFDSDIENLLKLTESI
jgi:hypothetical protein